MDMAGEKKKSVEEVDEFFLHALVDVTVAGEGFTAFFVTAEGADEVRVFNLLVEIADKDASSKITFVILLSPKF